jgi:hypothetical protein
LELGHAKDYAAHGAKPPAVASGAESRIAIPGINGVKTAAEKRPAIGGKKA